LEALAEKFHMSRPLLQQLNRGADFGKAGTHITVVNVPDKPKPAAKAARVEVDKSREAVTAFDANGRMIAYYPASVGSRSLPSPTGLRKVRAIATSPKYYYRPDSGVAGPKENLTIAAGPNNPVGSVWIDLDAAGYGIHGTPEPEDIGKTFSHGCVRLTNWDAQELATLVAPGTPVEFVTVVARSSNTPAR
jgi:lipoprotein-anchoring transpeptidase ErfK/SrfK